MIVVFLVVWNAGLLYAWHLGGGIPWGGLTPIGMKMSAFVLLAASVFAIAVATSGAVQERLVEPTRAENFRARDFYILALATGTLALMQFFMPGLVPFPGAI